MLDLPSEVSWGDIYLFILSCGKDKKEAPADAGTSMRAKNKSTEDRSSAEISVAHFNTMSGDEQ
jgi:hypothetical protein